MKERLEVLAREAIADSSWYIRCHEAARLIARHLRLQEFEVRIRDGLVVYHLPSILKGISLEEEIELTREWQPFAHSWCEVSIDEKVFLIDWHGSLPIESRRIEDFLLVYEKDTTPHKHHRLGFRIAHWIVFPVLLPPCIIKLQKVGR